MDQNICQSCGMPMNNQEEHGTEADGTFSQRYCTYCYQNGVFTSGDTTVEEFAQKMIEVSKGIPGAPQMTIEEAIAMLKNLERWKE